jgi:histidyl-tRNA synthetase
MVADAEVLKVLTEIITDLQLGQFEVKINHRGLLDAMLAIAGEGLGAHRRRRRRRPRRRRHDSFHT